MIQASYNPTTTQWHIILGDNLIHIYNTRDEARAFIDAWASGDLENDE